MFTHGDRLMSELESIPAHKPRSAIKLWKKFLGLTEAKQAFKTGLAASISLVLGLSFADVFERPDSLVSGLWCVMASIVVMQANLGGTYNAALIRFLGVVVGSIAGAIFINAIGSDPISLGISVFCTIVICSLLNIKDSFRIAGLSTAVIIILGSHHPAISPWLFSFYRFLDSCIGIFVALIVSRLIWPAKAVEDIRKNMAKILNTMSKYYLLSTSLEPDAAGLSKTMEAHFVEIDDLLQENRDNRKAAELELFDAPPKKEYWILLSDQLEIIFDAVNSMRHVHKETLSKIFDDPLAKCVDDVIDKTNLAFQEIERIMRRDISKASFEGLDAALKTMAAELSRFRGTRTTRKFNLEDVESFYVYFYSLRTIGESIIKMNQQINELPTS